MEIVDGAIILFLVFFVILGYILNKKLEIDREKTDNNYLLAKRKLRKASSQKEEEDDDVQDFVDSLPTWLSSIAQGAKIDLEAVYEGDPVELQKVKDILDKHLPKTQGSSQGSIEGTIDNPIR